MSITSAGRLPVLLHHGDADSDALDQPVADRAESWSVLFVPPPDHWLAAHFAVFGYLDGEGCFLLSVRCLSRSSHWDSTSDLFGVRQRLAAPLEDCQLGAHPPGSESLVVAA